MLISFTLGYGKWKGTKLSADELWALYDGLEQNNLVKDYSHVLTGTHISRARAVLLPVTSPQPVGYVGSSDFLSTVGRMVSSLKKV